MAADVLTVVLAKTEEREAPYGQLLLRVSLALDDPDAAPLRRAIASVAAVRAQHGLARLLADEDEPEEDPRRRTPVPDFGGGRPLTLGERKSLARRRDRELLARVIRDPHPDVIRVLLDNPALTEDDVVRLAARRPVPGAVLVELFRHCRWVVRPRLRLALALNPHTPQRVALQLVPHLNSAERRQVHSNLELADAVREACLVPSTERLH